MKPQAVLFDFIGTVVKERDPHTINRCFAQAFWDVGLEVEDSFIARNRGRNKREIFDLYVKINNLDSDVAEQLYQSFRERVSQELNNFIENEDVPELFSFLKSLAIKIGIGTGLSRDLFEAIIEGFDWNAYQIEYIGIAEEIGVGRPDPAMVLDMMKRFKITNAAHVIKIGDTVADIEEGKNASVITVALNAGTQPLKKLRDAQPDFIIENLVELRKIITR